MTNADQDRVDRLNDQLDAQVAGETTSRLGTDSDEVAAIQRLFAQDDAPPPPHKLQKQLWEELMNQAALAGRIPLKSSANTRPSLNARVPTGPAQMREPLGRQMSSPWFSRLAAAFLLLLALGAGYYRLNPFGGTDRPNTIPAAFAPAATPEISPTPYSKVSHPMRGMWQMAMEPSQSRTASTIFVLNADGSFEWIDNQDWLSQGAWRPTGERTGEIVIHQHGVASEPDYFAPEYDGAGPNLRDVVWVWTMEVTVDETGNAIVVTSGTIEVFRSGVPDADVFDGVYMEGIRLIPAEIPTIVP